MDFSKYVERQKEWSLQTFGKGERTDGIIKHIQHELEEVSSSTGRDKLEECIDIIILAMDMAWRLGWEPQTIEDMLLWKQIKNFQRQWPSKEVSEANQNEPTFHLKTDEEKGEYNA